MKFLQSILSLKQFYTDAAYADAAKVMIPYRDEIMNHYYIGSLACMPNEPKPKLFFSFHISIIPYTLVDNFCDHDWLGVVDMCPS